MTRDVTRSRFPPDVSRLLDPPRVFRGRPGGKLRGPDAGFAKIERPRAQRLGAGLFTTLPRSFSGASSKLKGLLPSALTAGLAGLTAFLAGGESPDGITGIISALVMLAGAIPFSAAMADNYPPPIDGDSLPHFIQWITFGNSGQNKRTLPLGAYLNSAGEVVIGLPAETHVRAMAEGRVEEIYYNEDDPFETHILVRHPDGSAILYAHLKYPFRVREGDVIEKGAVLGVLAGEAQGDEGGYIHLDLEFQQGDAPADPKSATALEAAKIEALLYKGSSVRLANYDAVYGLPPTLHDTLVRTGIIKIGPEDESFTIDQIAAPEKEARSHGRTLSAIRALTSDAKRWRELGELDAAQEILLKANAEFPRTGRILCSLGALEEARGDTAKARHWYLTALKYDQQDNTPRNSLGNLELDAGNPQTAKRWFLASLGHDPKDVYAMTSLARLEITIGNIRQGRGWLERTLHYYPLNTVANTYMGHLAMLAGQFDDAERWYRKLLRPDLHHVKQFMIMNRIGYLYLLRGQDGEAEVYFKDALERYDNNYLAMIGLAFLALKQGNAPAARELYERALASRIIPKQIDRLKSLMANVEANIAIHEGNYGRARDLLAKAAGERSDNAGAILLLGKLELLENNYKKAISLFERVLGLEYTTRAMWLWREAVMRDGTPVLKKQFEAIVRMKMRDITSPDTLRELREIVLSLNEPGFHVELSSLELFRMLGDHFDIRFCSKTGTQ